MLWVEVVEEYTDSEGEKKGRGDGELHSVAIGRGEEGSQRHQMAEEGFEGCAEWEMKSAEEMELLCTWSS